MEKKITEHMDIMSAGFPLTIDDNPVNILYLLSCGSLFTDNNNYAGQIANP